VVLKPSTVKDASKEVVFWTPVVIEDRFPATVTKRKVQYRTNTPLNNQKFPRKQDFKVAEAKILKVP